MQTRRIQVEGPDGSYGISFPIVPPGTCFRCLYPEPPGGIQPTCETAGILGPAASMVAATSARSFTTA